jgi:hypothetical protein
MKKIDIPQEKNDAVDGKRKVMYAPNDNGEFQRHKYGSSVEEYATKLAVNEYEELQKEAIENIKAGLSSPIEYFMYKNRMDLPTLASVTGMFQFRIKRHLKAKHFKKLNDKLLGKYALAFNIDIKDLKEFSYE